jgi:predicted acylesterase/phospholipase RssA
VTDYPTHPPLECDVVLKGGITSGVIYPKAVCELATVYRLRSVGGSSAGAIAAAAAAAAELGRQTGATGPRQGFRRLESLPDDITADSPGGGSVLFGLFQPQPATFGFYRAFTAGMRHPSWPKWLSPLPALFREYLGWVTAGVLVTAVPLVVGVTGHGRARWAALAAGLLLVAVGSVVGIVLGVLRSLGTHVPANGFGLCSGMPGPWSSPAVPALTPWLHTLIQETAGRTGDGNPITFGDLDAAGIELRVMTTNLTRREPLAMPWAGREWFFDPALFRRLFPDNVVAWMEDHPPELTGGDYERQRALQLRAQALPLRPLPEAPQLPILVATRMSLSFPLLLSAVPLHAVDYADPAGSRDNPKFGINWWSDGGICSNLPVHFFDSPVPSRPTFAVDLAGLPPGGALAADQCDNSDLPLTNGAGQRRRWTRFKPTGIGATLGFGKSIVDSGRSWVDESHLTMPGYRDRIVTIFHDADEGGMNLTMSRTTVDNLATRGQCAASKLVERFAGPQPGVTAADGWENQRWIRLRTATAGLDAWLAAFRGGYAKPSPGATPYADLAGPGARAEMPSYALTQARRDAVNERVGHLLGLAGEWAGEPADAFTYRAPAPRPRLKLVPDDGAPDASPAGADPGSGGPGLSSSGD